MLPIFWRASARANLAAIIRFIASENPRAARRMRELIETAVLPTAEHPYLFRASKVAGTREIVVHPNYILIYQVTATRIEVVNIVHARREFPTKDAD